MNFSIAGFWRYGFLQAGWWILLWLSWWCLLPYGIPERGPDGFPVYPGIAEAYQQWTSVRAPGWPNDFHSLLLFSLPVGLLAALLVAVVRSLLRPLSRRYLLVFVVLQFLLWTLWLEPLHLALIAVLMDVVAQQEDLASTFNPANTPWFALPVNLVRWWCEHDGLIWQPMLVVGLIWYWLWQRRTSRSEPQVPPTIM